MTRAASVLALALLACTPTKPGAIEPRVEAALEPKPTLVVEPEPAPVATPPARPDELPVAQAHKRYGNDEQARFGFEQGSFAGDLELQIVLGDEGTGMEFRHVDRVGVLDDGPTLCLNEFYQGDSVGAHVFDHGQLDEGRRLLELWASCRIGEDIVSVENVVWLVIDDGVALTQVWKGEANFHGSHVCATFDDLDFVREGDEVVLTRTEVGEIYEPGVVEYDCEHAREYVESRGSERIPLR
ncbi:hypothetical protein ACNOYE_38245 [Nannocystaceae bacterium ST9]